MVINGVPRIAKYMDSGISGFRVIRIREEEFVEMGVHPLAECKQGEHPIVYGCQMAEEVDDAVLAGDDGLQEFVITAFVANAIVRDDASGFGPTGPRAPLPANDHLMQALSGVEAAQGGAGAPPTFLVWGAIDVTSSRTASRISSN